MRKIVTDRYVENEDGSETVLKGKPVLFMYMQADGSFAEVHGNNDSWERKVSYWDPFEPLVGRQMEVTTELDVPSGKHTIKDWRFVP